MRAPFGRPLSESWSGAATLAPPHMKDAVGVALDSILVSMHVCRSYTYVSARILLYMHAHIHVYTYLYLHMYKHAYICTCTHKHAYVCTNMHMHVHSHN